MEITALSEIRSDNLSVSLLPMTPWVSCLKSNPLTPLRLFCFPYAGAGASSFNSWAALMPEIELYLVHLPGRDKRIREPLHERLTPMVELLTEALIPHLDKPFAFFGHSMGALVSFEVARQLRRKHAPQPVHLFISARQPPQKVDPDLDLYRLPEDEFLAATEKKYGVLPDVVRQDHEVLRLFLSIMRADLTMLGTYQYEHESPLDCSISVFGGLSDKSVNESDLRGWSEQTSSTFDLKMLPGEHFFIRSSQTTLLNEITQSLSHLLHS